jgi:putative endonuclease
VAGGTSRGTSRRARGRLGEELAVEYLRRRGARILARNVHVRHAEVDVVALDGTTLCFVEVRLRASDRFGRAEESVDARKRLRVRRAAAHILATRALPFHRRVRFDVVAIDAATDPPRLTHIRDAF